MDATLRPGDIRSVIRERYDHLADLLMPTSDGFGDEGAEEVYKMMREVAAERGEEYEVPLKGERILSERWDDGDGDSGGQSGDS